MTTNPFPRVPFPAGAVKADRQDLGSLNAFRYFKGSRRIVDRPHHDTDIDIYISGAQHHDGSVSREIVVHGLNADHPLTIKQARQPRASASTPWPARSDDSLGFSE
jgi:hypothetical protein